MHQFINSPITLSEYQPTLIDAHLLSDSVAQTLWRDYRHLIEIEAPSFKTGGCWRLTNLGWAGYLPLSPGFGIALQPKVALHTLLRMVEVAYDLHALRLFDGLFNAQSVPEFYEVLARLLAKRVLHRCRQGLYRTYRVQQAALPYVRGQLQLATVLQQPAHIDLPCRFQEHTADVADNQILLWTLQQIARSELCGDRAAPVVRQAIRALQGAVTVQPFTPWACRQRTYTRLNQDYAPLHGLCAFFLEHTSPSHRMGDLPAMPFVVEMARLYERFVAAWLQTNVGEAWRIQAQESHAISREQRFAIDLVLYGRSSGVVRSIMDTKYKVAARADMADIAQVVAYAQAKGATEAVLIYPQPLAAPLDVMIGDIHVRTLTFALDGDLDQAGQALLTQITEG